MNDGHTVHWDNYSTDRTIQRRFQLIHYAMCGQYIIILVSKQAIYTELVFTSEKKK